MSLKQNLVKNFKVKRSLSKNNINYFRRHGLPNPFFCVDREMVSVTLLLRYGVTVCRPPIHASAEGVSMRGFCLG